MFLRVLGVLALVAYVSGCGPNQPDPIDPATQDPLWADVIDSHTRGLVSKESTIRMRFADDIILEDRVGNDASPVLSIEPPIRGSLTHASRRDIVLVPDEDLVGGQRYVVTLRRGRLLGIPDSLDEFQFDRLFRFARKKYPKAKSRLLQKSL